MCDTRFTYSQVSYSQKVHVSFPQRSTLLFLHAQKVVECMLYLSRSVVVSVGVVIEWVSYSD